MVAFGQGRCDLDADRPVELLVRKTGGKRTVVSAALEAVDGGRSDLRIRVREDLQQLSTGLRLLAVPEPLGRQRRRSSAIGALEGVILGGGAERGVLALAEQNRGGLVAEWRCPGPRRGRLRSALLTVRIVAAGQGGEGGASNLRIRRVQHRESRAPPGRAARGACPPRGRAASQGRGPASRSSTSRPRALCRWPSIATRRPRRGAGSRRATRPARRRRPSAAAPRRAAPTGRTRRWARSPASTRPPGPWGSAPCARRSP
jgi:hypothetical protein